ncbi:MULTISPECIES: T9SS type A sorting domain-containing protein [Niastella]|uniref:T9SS type A sorting domain-containing protein n=1 Tax=Niastella soli TaxID=2821487 RepID=A0ABS3YP79_9BACT|nr:T9SS type A sorting domain-containing protein [Niastella soli]MBO9199682.1 T9SS type A sorting domain-containing protein [Niastella soli]
MKKGVLVYFICLLVHVCTAQEAPSAIPVGNTDSTDTSSFVTGLSVNIRENSKVVLNWKQPEDTSFTFASIERSSGGREFEVVAVIKQSDIKPDNEWIDDSPTRGRSLYRVRFSGKSGFQQAFSRSVEALVAGDISFRFYPNPVDNILIIRSEAVADIQIVDATGKQRMGLNNLQGLQTLNVSTLEKGIYFLRINNHNTGLLTQEKLLKN